MPPIHDGLTNSPLVDSMDSELVFLSHHENSDSIEILDLPSSDTESGHETNGLAQANQPEECVQHRNTLESTEFLSLVTSSAVSNVKIQVQDLSSPLSLLANADIAERIPSNESEGRPENLPQEASAGEARASNFEATNDKSGEGSNEIPLPHDVLTNGQQVKSRTEDSEPNSREDPKFIAPFNEGLPGSVLGADEGNNNERESDLPEPISTSKTIIAEETGASSSSNERPPIHPIFKETVCHYQSSDGKEYVLLKKTLPIMVDQLNFSARLLHKGLQIHLHNEGCLLVIDNNFVAKVKIQNVAKLMQSKSFEEIKTSLLHQLQIVDLFEDELNRQRDQARLEMLNTLDMMMDSAASSQLASDAVQVLRMLQSLRNPIKSYQQFSCMLTVQPNISQNLHQLAATLFEVENICLRRNQSLSIFDTNLFGASGPLLAKLNQFYETVAENRSKTIIEKAPIWLQKLMKDLPKQKLILISESDVKLFTDMSSTLNQDIFEKPLEGLAQRWINMINSTKSNEIVSLTSPMYFFLCRSLEELITEISKKTELQPSELLVSNRNGWYPPTNIKWKTESNLTKCLHHEYYFIMKLIKHFDLAELATRKPFSYQPRLYNEAISNDQKSALKKIINRVQKMFKAEQQPVENPSTDAEKKEPYVWFCLLDYVLANVLPNTGKVLNVFEDVIQNILTIICGATIAEMETIRVTTHNTVRFIVQTFPHLGEIATEDKQTLLLQLNVINNATQGSGSTTIFRDLIDVFNYYWRNRSEIIELLLTKCELDEMRQLKNSLLKIVLTSLDKLNAAEQIVLLFRCFNDFLVDLNNIPYDWLIKSVPELNMKNMVKKKEVEPVGSKWDSTDNQTFRVINAKKFRGVVQALLEDGETVKHYTFEIINTLLSMVQDQLGRTQWKEDKSLTACDQLYSSGVLIAAMRESLLYLRNQAEYVSFEQFLSESIKPFASVVQNSTSMANFNSRIALIKESFWYIRKQNEMSIQEALQYYHELNDGELNEELILQCHQRYTENYERYMENALGQDCVVRQAAIVAEVRESVEAVLFKNWDAEFKQEKVPKILAGLAAVWSLMVSQDVACTGKYLQPHCIQILCILRLLSVDNAEKGVTKHLAQVLTGQGKSLILGFISALLALTGHKVQIACYSEYLVERDQKDFEKFYELFGVKSKITYGTIDSLAESIIDPEIDGVSVELRDLMVDLLFSPKKERKECPAILRDNSVLLMDEVDVFFTEQYYGSEYRAATFTQIAGLAAIQENIWKIVCQGNHDKTKVYEETQAFIAAKQFAEFEKFNQFYSRKEQFEIIEEIDNTYRTISHTNRSLFNSHLQNMVEDAIIVCKMSEPIPEHKLCSSGAILVKDNEHYTMHAKQDYTTTFAYLRLKKTDFVTEVDGGSNYGYLNLDCGAISYAMLPKNFSMILGVTGTLASLNVHEQATLKDVYSINRSSIMPSFFGCSNLQFNPEHDFKHFPIEADWMTHIFSQACAVIRSKRAVIVFFVDDAALEKFRQEYSGQFDRLKILTVNTAEEDVKNIIVQAGVAKTITLATRGMGRGVDYQSSVTVEQNGGVHVIQTFFSLDIREETQIKGRTARKDNKGSYELIVCREHLKQEELIQEEDEITYSSIDAVREELYNKKNQEIVESIEKAQKNHDTTMAYLKSFFT